MLFFGNHDIVIVLILFDRPASSFHKEPKKYQVVKRNPWIKERRKAIKKFEFNLETKFPSKLPTAVQDVLKHLVSYLLLGQPKV